MIIDEKTILLMEETLKIAGDATRLKILFSLLSNENLEIEKCVNDIANEVDESQSLTSHQLKVLKDGDFVKSRKNGTKIYYSLKDEHVKQIVEITYDHILERVK